MPRTDVDSTVPRFHMEAVEDAIATAAAGRPIYRQEERVQIIQPGNPNSPVMLVNEDHRNKWPDQYARFRAGEDHTIDGTPIEQWPFLKKVNVLELKGKGIFTVEQCAALSDLACQGLGMGGTAIRSMAKAYLDDAEAIALVTMAVDQRDKAEAQVATLQRQLDELKSLTNQMHTELMALKNAPSPIMTYVPGMHDPVQQAMQDAPRGAVAGSSLDALTATPRRGRPPVNRDAAA
jgi:hypothetical protein